MNWKKYMPMQQKIWGNLVKFKFKSTQYNMVNKSKNTSSNNIEERGEPTVRTENLRRPDQNLSYNKASHILV